jgi:hypothetical protein
MIHPFLFVFAHRLSIAAMSATKKQRVTSEFKPSARSAGASSAEVTACEQDPSQALMVARNASLLSTLRQFMSSSAEFKHPVFDDLEQM